MEAQSTAYDTLNKGNKKLFQAMIKLYDQKLYKKAMKNADKILETEPTHGETISMKAMLYNTIGKKKLAYETIKLGIARNFKSFTSWHIMGLINRSDKKYAEAKGAFAQSARIDPENLKIIRDLLLLEMHNQDYAGACKSITTMMKTQARNKVYCNTYIMMHHLNGEYEKAINFIEQNREFMTTKQSKMDKSELLIYEAIIYKDAGKFDQAIELLNTHESDIRDKSYRLEFLAELHTAKGDLTEAKACYEQLNKRNPSCVMYYEGLFQCEGVDINNIDAAAELKIKEILTAKMEEHPKLLFLKRYYLKFCSDRATFTEYFESYTKQFLEKGIPSLVNDVENMIQTDPMKFEVVQSTFTKFMESMEADSTIDGEEQDPMQLCFLYMFLGQTYQIEGDYLKALDLIEKAIAHTPTLIELWQLKAKIMENLGNHNGAEVAYRRAHELDTADRFLNAECAKYVMRNGNKIDDASKIMIRWSEDPNTNEMNAYEYQNLWYEVESGYAEYRKKDYLAAFKYFSYIDKHLVTMSQDFYDFHFYTIRKFQFRSYMKTAGLSISIKTSKYVQEGCVGILKALDRFYKQANHSDSDKRDEFAKWLDEEVAKHPDREEGWNEWKEFTPETDALDKQYDPLAAKALKAVVDKGIAIDASERLADGLKHNPTNQQFHKLAVKWHLRNKKYHATLDSLAYLNSNHAECPSTAYANTRAKLYFEDDEVRSATKEKQLALMDEKLAEYTQNLDARAYLKKATHDADVHSIPHQRYYLKGITNLLKESVTIDHFVHVTAILKAHKDESTKKNILKYLNDTLSILKLVPEDQKTDFIEL